MNSSSLTGYRVMVVDDSYTVRLSAETFLKALGCQVVLAENGFEALAKVVQHQPDFIFMDVMMPRLDGFQTCSLIKRNPHLNTIPVVMLTTKEGLFDRARAKIAGANHYLTKPFNQETLHQTMLEFANSSMQSSGFESSAIMGNHELKLTSDDAQKN